jgi:hypothetical protein
MKKGQGISLNVIVIAAIALLVLVLLSVIFVGRIGQFGTKSSECEEKGGKCYDGVICPAMPGKTLTKFPGSKCPTQDNQPRVCCIVVE